MHRVLSTLLDYPDEDILTRREEIAAGAPGELASFLAWWSTSEPRLVRERYVRDFDLSRGCAPYLTFHRFGDRRDRGRALIALKRLYRTCGWELPQWELPDYLPLVLEFASVEPETGHDVLAEFAVELEAIRRALAARESPWAEVLAYVVAGLPAPDERDVERLLAEGPPAELVGVGT
jgi:nitrate reductase molybdenum cofactor assembly chaperone NarJ/NarW